MRRRFTGIAAFLMLLLTMPVSRACVVLSQAAKAQPDCCNHKALADACCKQSSDVCCTTPAPVDTTPYPIQSVALLAVPSASVATVYNDHPDNLRSRCFALHLPAQHAPPGLLIAATIVLRI